MDDIQSWWEVPSIAHFCSLFRAAFNLLDFDIEELEEALLTDGTEDSGSSLLQELIVRLLCGCLGNNDISTFNYQMFLRRLFRQKCQEYGRDNPFNTDMDFQFLPLRTKVEILHALCDFRLDADDVQDLLKNLESDSLRVEPLGHDENNSAYWYFYGTRLYREDYPKPKKKTKEKHRKGKEEKKKRKHGKTPLDNDLDEKGAVWQVVCFTEQDWDRITEGFKDSRSKVEKELYHTLSEDFLPEIPRLFAEKERLQRKRMLEYQPRRQSSRLEKLKQQKFEEENLQKSKFRKEEKEQQTHRKQEQDRKDKLRKRNEKESRANRALIRSLSRTNSECGSNCSITDEIKLNQPTTFVGRQTNNSLSSATGQIVIQGLRRKLRSSQVFRQTEEDLQTGMYKILEFIKNHEDAWPFLEPVDEQYAPRYYSIIHKPMDLQKMEDKLDEGEYMSFSEFKSDFQLIVDNCRKYNGSDNEYSEMVGNLLEAFQQAVDRYLESEPSSDEEVAVEFPEKVQEKPQILRQPNRKKKEVTPVQEPPARSPSLPSMPSTPSSEESNKVPDVEKESVKSDVPVEPPDSEASSTKEEEDTKCFPNPRKKKKLGVIKNAPDIEALELATEQTLKDINKWLDDTPRFSEFSSASNSPSHLINTEDYDSRSRTETDFRRSLKIEKPQRLKDAKDNAKRRLHKDPAKQSRRREVQRTIDRLQPGKSKGNLISNIQSAGKVTEEGPPGKQKDTRSCLFPVVNETTPKLSLGTVLGTDVLGFGVGLNKHNFEEENKQEVKVLVNEEQLKQVIDIGPKTPESPVDSEPIDDNSEKKGGEDVDLKPIIKENRAEKIMPNLSAWFKAFGAPKTSANSKKRIESLQESSFVDSMSGEERRESSTAYSVEHLSDKVVSNETRSVIIQDVSRPPVVVEAKNEEIDSRLSPQPKGIVDEVPCPLPTSRQLIARQRKVSTGSSVSERSSFSQDLMDPADGSSPRLGLDEHLGNYSVPYSSPIHQSPMAASPVIASPRPEEGPKFASYPPLNGTIRVGFYQDTSFSLQKNSPEKNSSHSPKDHIQNVFPTYSPRMYPPHDPGGFLTYQKKAEEHTHTSFQNSTYSTSPAVTYYDTSKPLTDQYRAARTQESDVLSGNSSPNVEMSTSSISLNSSPQPLLEVTTSSTTTAKSCISVFPVKKRLYSELESMSSPQATNKYKTTLVTPPPAHSQSTSRVHSPQESPVALHNVHRSKITSALEPTDSTMSATKVYATRKSAVSESMRVENTMHHISKKPQNVKTIQSYNVANVEGERSHTSLQEDEMYMEKHKTSPQSNSRPKESRGQLYSSLSSVGEKHIPTENLNDHLSSDDKSSDIVRVQHSSVITSLRNSNLSQEFSNETQTSLVKHSKDRSSHFVVTSEHPSDITPQLHKKLVERFSPNAPKSDSVLQSILEKNESVRSGRLHSNIGSTTSGSAPKQLQSTSNPALRGTDLGYHRGPFSPVAPSPLAMEHLALHGNLANLTQLHNKLAEGFPSNEQLLSGLPSTSSYYGQNVSTALSTSISCSSAAMALLSQSSPAIMTIAYNNESQISSSPIPFNRPVSELPSLLTTKVNSIQPTYTQSVQDLSTILPNKRSSPISAPGSYSRPVSDLSVTHTTKVSTLHAQTPYQCVSELQSVLPTKATAPEDLKSYNQSVTDLSTLQNKVSTPPSITSGYSRSAAEFSLLPNKVSDSHPPPKTSRKRKSKQISAPSNEVSVVTTSDSTAFQQYVGLSTSPNGSEPSAIALKTASVLSGSAFNFGPAHSGLGLYSTDKEGYPGYLEEYRTAPASYYIPAPDPSHDKINPASHPSGPTPSIPFPFSGHSRPPTYALAQAFMNHQAGLVDPSAPAPPLYQQYLHRHPEELLRHSGSSMVIHQGLLPPGSYTAGYHPALGIRQPYDSLTRPTWL